MIYQYRIDSSAMSYIEGVITFGRPQYGPNGLLNHIATIRVDIEAGKDASQIVRALTQNAVDALNAGLKTKMTEAIKGKRAIMVVIDDLPEPKR